VKEYGYWIIMLLIVALALNIYGANILYQKWVSNLSSDIADLTFAMLIALIANILAILSIMIFLFVFRTHEHPHEREA